MIEPAVSPKRARYLRHVRRQSRRVRLWQLAILVGFFAFWELSCRVGLSDGFLVSSPSRIAATFLSLCRSGDTAHNRKDPRKIRRLFRGSVKTILNISPSSVQSPQGLLPPRRR